MQSPASGHATSIQPTAVFAPPRHRVGLSPTEWGLVGLSPHWLGWTWPACLGGRAQLRGFTPAMLAGLGAERSHGVFFGSPARHCVGRGSWSGR